MHGVEKNRNHLERKETIEHESFNSKNSKEFLKKSETVEESYESARNVTFLDLAI